MSNPVDEALGSLDNTSTCGGVTFINPSIVFSLSDSQNNEVLRINADGTFSIGAAYQNQIDKAGQEFVNWLNTYCGGMQMAVADAERRVKEECINKIEAQARQWGVMRSLKMTYSAQAAYELADLLRK